MKFTFRHEDKSLVGRLLVPTGKGPFPAVILLTGYGSVTSPLDINFGYLLPLGKYLASHGIAVLDYDRPGTGKSTGDWRFQTLYDRSDEALEAVESLRQQPLIDPAQIGLLGHSNGGWVAPLASSLSPAVAFVVTLAGPAVSIAEQGKYSLRKRMESEGWTDEKKKLMEKAVKILQELVRLILEGRITEFKRRKATLDRLVGRAPHLAEAIASSVIELPEWSDRPALMTSMAMTMDYDPLPTLRKVKCPLLGIFGEVDPVVDSRESAGLFETGLRKAGHERCVLKIYPGEGHGVGVHGGADSEQWSFIAKWIREQVGPGESGEFSDLQRSDRD